ncbi:S41 family peptidase [Hyphobacterium sp. CCMP332]|nr:S41 family peptidase [Hyphobacterium sp. CCMP332]
MNEDQNKYNLLLSLPILLALALVIGILTGLMIFNKEKKINLSQDPNYKKYKEIISLIEHEYVDKVNTEELTESTIREMLSKLDPHSSYIPYENREMSAISFESNYQGIGVEFNIIKDTLVVIAPLNGGPSEKLGILPGDRIIKIDNENVTNIGLTNKMVFDRLRGQKGSEVSLEIIRPGNNNTIQFNIIRDEIPSISIIAAYMLDETNAYIKISRFTESTAEEFNEKIGQLKSEGMQNLILDLRNNSGGILSSALFIVDELLEDDKLILYTKSKVSTRDFEYTSRIKGGFEKGKLIILINEGSASASEIVAGALQDHDRAVLIGRRSFGKGLVQSSFDLNDGSELRMTISRYYIPSGRSIQKPYANGREEYLKELIERYENGEFFHAENIEFPDSLTFSTASGRKVYGGGGIMPDIFVPTDTSLRSNFLLELNSKGLLYEFAFDYSNTHRKYLEEMGEEKFVEDFKINEKLLNDLIEFAVNEGINFKKGELQRSEEMIKVQLKALIARNLWRDNGFYKVYNCIDPNFEAALDELQ